MPGRRGKTISDLYTAAALSDALVDSSPGHLRNESLGRGTYNSSRIGSHSPLQGDSELLHRDSAALHGVQKALHEAMLARIQLDAIVILFLAWYILTFLVNSKPLCRVYLYTSY